MTNVSLFIQVAIGYDQLPAPLPHGGFTRPTQTRSQPSEFKIKNGEQHDPQST